MMLDLRAEKRPGLLGRSDTLAMLEIYVEKAVKQLHIAVPIVTGPEGMGRSAVLHELLERSRNTGRTGGYGCVRSGLGQALIDATTSLAVSIKSLYPDSHCTTDLILAAEDFRRRSPDEATEEGFVSAIDHLLYALSTALSEVARGYLLCIDDLQFANDGRVRVFLEGLIALSSTGAPIPVVLTSSVGLGVRVIPQGLDQLQLRPLTNADLADIAQRQGVIATPEVIRQIGEYVEGRPGRALEIIERASAKGLVDAHTVRAVIAESKILGAERDAFADAERIAAQVRTAAPDTSEVPAPTEAPECSPAGPVTASAFVGGFDRSLPTAHTDHVVTKSQVYLDGLEMTDPTTNADLIAATGIELVSPVAMTGVETSVEPNDFTDSGDSAPVSPEPAESIALRVELVEDAVRLTVPVARPSDAVALPVREEGMTRFSGAVQAAAAAPQAQLLALTPTQRRVLGCIAEAADAAVRSGSAPAVRVALVKRTLGEVSRFGGAASPVGDALESLGSAGFLQLDGDTLTLTELGRRHSSVTTDE